MKQITLYCWMTSKSAYCGIRCKNDYTVMNVVVGSVRGWKFSWPNLTIEERNKKKNLQGDIWTATSTIQPNLVGGVIWATL